MSKYKYEFGVATTKNGSDCISVVDLVEDWGYNESDLDGRTEKDILDELQEQGLEDYVWSNIDSWVKRIDG